jgi:hypothetical protein
MVSVCEGVSVPVSYGVQVAVKEAVFPAVEEKDGCAVAVSVLIAVDVPVSVTVESAGAAGFVFLAQEIKTIKTAIIVTLTVLSFMYASG